MLANSNRFQFSLAALFMTILASSAMSQDSRTVPLSKQGAVVTLLSDAESGEFVKGTQLFLDRRYQLLEPPDWLNGQKFVRSNISGFQCEIIEGGLLTLLVPFEQHPATKFQGPILEKQGFHRVQQPESFQLFGPNTYERVVIYQKQVTQGEAFRFDNFAIIVGQKDLQRWMPPDWKTNDGERLENGIVLPTIWPPRHLQPGSREPMPVPYLKDPPAVITIDRGRQLFVDDFLIQNTSLSRTFHQPKKSESNPVFRPETVYELTASGDGTSDRNATNYLGHGGVFFDPTEKVFKMFYTAGWRGGLAMATSQDMIHWSRPQLNLAGENLLLPSGPSWKQGPLTTAGSDNSIWLDVDASDPKERLKYLTCWMHTPKQNRHPDTTHSLHTSDGVNWSAGAVTGVAEDYCSFFYNPFRRVWVYSIKQGGPHGRCRYYSENKDFIAGADWSNQVYWTGADRLDAPEPAGRYPGAGEPTQLYSLNAVAYESLMVGMHLIHRGPRNEVCGQGNFPKLTDLEIGFSRDGFHWDRPDRTSFIAGSRAEGSWDRAYLHSATGVFVVAGDQLVFPYTAYSGVSPSGQRGMYTGGSVGIATLRRDGFASMDARDTTGTLTTRPLQFSGDHLFVNLNAPQGELRVAVIDEQGNEVTPFTTENCRPVTGDSTLSPVTWNGAEDFSTLRSRPVRFRFTLQNGELYSFWVSRDKTGRSDGFVAAGGPGYPGTVDTVGRAAVSSGK